MKIRPELRRIHGVNFIRVSGSAVERARAHASLLRDEVRAGAMPHLAKKNELNIRRGPGLTQIPAVQKFVVWFYRNVLMKHMDRNLPSETRAIMRAAAEETGLPYETFLHGICQADALMLLCRLSIMKYTMGDMPAAALPGCTSAVTLPQWAKSGRMLACRNFDYPMVGPWEPHQTVVFQEPDEPGRMPHVSVTTAGVHTSGVTSVNREGLTLFAHAHFGRHVSIRGDLITDIGTSVIQSATTIGEAVDIVRKHRRCANWAFVIGSAKEKSAAVLEMTPTKLVVREPEDGFIAHTNAFRSQLQREEGLISGACVEDFMARYCRIRQLLEPHRGSLEPSHMTQALGDQIDYFTGVERVMGNTVGVVDTVKSVVFDPEIGKFWTSTRKESPTGLGDYVEVDVEKFWKTSPEELEKAPMLKGYQPKTPGLIEGISQFRDAYRAYHMDDRPGYRERSIEHLRRANRVYPSDGNLWIQTALVAFELKLFDEARKALEQTLALKLTRHAQSVRDLFLGRCLDIQGEREKALEVYRRGMESVEEPRLKKAMKRGLARAYHVREIARIMVDLQFTDTFHY